jgi:hypothetical protein
MMFKGQSTEEEPQIDVAQSRAGESQGALASDVPRFSSLSPRV